MASSVFGVWPAERSDLRCLPHALIQHGFWAHGQFPYTAPLACCSRISPRQKAHGCLSACEGEYKEEERRGMTSKTWRNLISPLSVEHAGIRDKGHSIGHVTVKSNAAEAIWLHSAFHSFSFSRPRQTLAPIIL